MHTGEPSFGCLSSVRPVFTFVSVCHIIATTSCCSPRLRVSQLAVSRQRHSGLATSDNCRVNQTHTRQGLALFYSGKKYWLDHNELQLEDKVRLSFIEMRTLRTQIRFGIESGTLAFNNFWTFFGFLSIRYIVLFCRSFLLFLLTMKYWYSVK